ncbi:hypothetical protein [Streptomyces althioticus]|uniref:hypothetical protein n=1 Tax=Streptomyces althioticus TaxID=83380 RepID=UPI0033C01952
MFKQGDKVVFDQDGPQAEIQFGPVVSATKQESFVVKWLTGSLVGRSSIVHAAQLDPLPRFKVGQEVKFVYDTDVMHVVAGPFPSDGDNLWVVKDEQGDHYSSAEEFMTPVVE